MDFQGEEAAALRRADVLREKYPEISLQGAEYILRIFFSASISEFVANEPEAQADPEKVMSEMMADMQSHIEDLKRQGLGAMLQEICVVMSDVSIEEIATRMERV